MISLSSCLILALCLRKPSPPVITGPFLKCINFTTNTMDKATYIINNHITINITLNTCHIINTNNQPNIVLCVRQLGHPFPAIPLQNPPNTPSQPTHQSLHSFPTPPIPTSPTLMMRQQTNYLHSNLISALLQLQ